MSDDLDDLRERADLLAIIAHAEQRANWTPIEDCASGPNCSG